MSVPNNPWKNLCILHLGGAMFLVMWSRAAGGRGTGTELKKEVGDPHHGEVVLLGVAQQVEQSSDEDNLKMEEKSGIPSLK